MGGKTKQSQRTKNNARPSSSGRSAELMSSVKLDSGIVNIAGTQLPALFPSLVAPSVDPLLTPELQLALKKLNKKDPITKTKALQELTELVTNSKVDDVVSALSSWSHFYKILTADPDRKVRECTQACHGTIVSVCGRRVAPHLKQLMPAWLQAQYDEHAPAQTHAHNSLAKTFPDNKLPEVLSFCKEEIISHLLDILIGNGESAHIRNTESAAARAAACSLHALQYCARHVPAPHRAWLAAQLEPLLRGDAFWQRAASTDPDIRAAWFGAMGSIISRYKGEFAAQYGTKTLRVLVGSRESNPLVAAQLWDCLLLFMHSVPDWHQYLEKSDLLSKRILDVLESGGWGDARHLSHMLLPILASLPPEMLTRDFHIAFFNAIFSGLEKKSILSSKSERQSWITSLDECLRYLSTQPHPYVLEIVSAVHRTWLEKVLTGAEGQTRNHLLRYSAGSMANLVRFWLKQAKEQNSEKYDQLIRNFWQNVGSTLTVQIDKLSLNVDEIDKLMEAHILLLHTLKSSFTQELKKQHSIKFEADTKAEEKSPSENRAVDPAVIDRYNHNLNELVESVCSHYFEFASKKQISNPVLSPLISLLVEFDSRSLFWSIARQFGCDSLYGWYEGVVRGWVCGDAMRCKALLDIVFIIMKHLNEKEQAALFDTFQQFPPAVVEWCISLSLSHPHCLSPSVRAWLRGGVVEATVASICSRVIDTGDNKAKNLLMMCLNCDANGESVVSASAVEKALQQLSASLYEVDAAALEARAGVAAQLATTLPPNETLLTALLSLTSSLQLGDARLSLDTWCEAREAWQDGVTALPPRPRARLLLRAAALLHHHLQLRSNLDIASPTMESSPKSEDSELNISKIEHIVSLCPYLLWRSSELDVAEVLHFTRTVFHIAPTCPLLIEAYATRHEILTGNLNCPLDTNEVTKAIINNTLTELSKEDLIAHVNTCLFRLTYLRTMFLTRPDDESDKNWCEELLSEEYFQEEFVKCIHEYAVICSLYEGYAFWPHYKLIEQSKARLGSLLQDIINATTPLNRKSISASLAKAAADKAYFWAYSQRYFDDFITQPDNNTKQTTTVDSSQVKTDSSQDKTDSSQDKTDGSQEKTDSSIDETTSPQMKTDDSLETGSSQGKPDRSQEKTDSSKDEVASSRVEADSSRVEADSSRVSESEATDKEIQSRETAILSKMDNLPDVKTKLELIHTLHHVQASSRGSSSWQSRLRSQHYAVLCNLYVCHAGAGLLGGEALRGGDPDPDLILNLYYKHHHIMLYEMDISKSDWQQVVCNSSICRFLASCVGGAEGGAGGWAAAPQHWDFTNITLCSLLTSAALARRHCHHTKVALLTRAVLELFCAAAAFIAAVRGGGGRSERSQRSQPPRHIAQLPTEWRDIYAPDVHDNLFSIILFLLESPNKTNVNSNHVSVIDGLIQCTAHMQWDSLKPAHRTGDYNLKRIVDACTTTLKETAHYAYKYLAYYVLKMILKPLVLEDAEKLAIWSQNASEETESDGEGAGVSVGGSGGALQLTLMYYDAAFRHLQDIVETALSHVKLGEEVCSLVACSDAHALTLGWLLLADILSRHCGLARGDLTHQYIQLYREQKYTEALLTTALRLLPQALLAQAAAPDSPHASSITNTYKDMFLALPPLDVYKWCGAEVVMWAACAALTGCVRGAGAGDARGWRGVAHHRHVLLLDNITRRYITPHVVKEEFALLQKKGSEIEDTEITINRSSYEVRCVLSVDDKPLELQLSLSRAHPLVLPRLRTPHRAAAAAAPAGSAHWLLMYLGYQNGTILNALKMWTASVNSKLERAPQCYICYCRLHHATGRLPAVHCHTCRNKFHNVCLRKWFLSSSKMTCPLCRANF